MNDEILLNFPYSLNNQLHHMFSLEEVSFTCITLDKEMCKISYQILSLYAFYNCTEEEAVNVRGSYPLVSHCDDSFSKISYSRM